MRTPVAVTPLAYSSDIAPSFAQAQLAMTPDTPSFAFSPLEGLGVKVSPEGDCKDQVVEPAWTEEEDAILQTVSTVSAQVEA